MKYRIPSSAYRFIVVGIINTLFGTAIMFVFYNVFHFSYWFSSASNYFFGSILSYFLNKHFTFRYGKADFKSIAKFTINIIVCYLLAYSIAKPIMAHLLSRAQSCLPSSIIWDNVFLRLRNENSYDSDSLL